MEGSGVKKIICCLTVIFMCFFSVNVFSQSVAEKTSDKLYVKAETTLQNVKITGKVIDGELNQKLTVLVFNDDKDKSDWGADGAVKNQAEIPLNENGEFEFSFDITVNDPEHLEYYKTYINTQGSEAALSLVIPVISDDVKSGAVITLNGSTEENVAQNINAIKDILIPGFDLIDAIDTDGLQNKILDKIADGGFNTADFNAVSKWLKRECVFEAYLQNKKSELTDSNGRLLYTKLLELENIDNTDDVTVYEIYTTKLNSAGVDNVAATLLGKSYANIDEYKKAFAKAVVIEGIRNYTDGGYGHINGIITKNASYVGLNTSLYKLPTTVKDKLLLEGNYGTMTEIQSVLNRSNTTTKPAGGGGGGGSYDGTGTKYPTTSSASNNIVTPEIEKKPVEFLIDMENHQWAAEYVNTMLKRGIVSMPEDGRFRPDDAVTREEFVKLLVLTFDIDLSADSDNTFTDVPQNSWSAPYVYAAHSLGIVKGINDSEFGAADTLLRQDMAVMICRTLEMSGTVIEKNQINTFIDDKEISDYANDAVYKLSSMGVINGMEDGSFAPNQLCTRAQAVKVLSMLLK